MAYYHPSPTTFCEVTYDSDWLNLEKDDRHLTPYRYSLVRNDTDTNSDTVSLTLPSYTYYEYLRSLYDCRSTPTRVPPPGYGPAGSHIGQQGRSVTWHAFNKDNASELSRQAVKSEPTRIRPTYPFPSLHLIQGGDSGDELEDEYAYADRTKEKLVWVDALNKWVPQKQLHPRPYMSFVGNAPVLEKHGRFPREIAGGSEEFEGAQTCERFEMHMGQRTSVSQPQDKSKSRNNEKREAIRKRAQELAEQKKQRKAYSTPLYTSLTERKQNLKPRIQSSRAHSSLPVSPVHRKEKIPSPKEVWQEEDRQKQLPEKKTPPVTVRREISIKLISPPPEDDVKEEDEDKDKLSEKKVTFIDEGKTTPKSSKKKKDEDADSYNSADKEEEMRLEEQRLIESLEKQRQLQQLEQQKLLAAEEQRKEKERKEKERIAEEERLRKLKESRNMQKQPLSTQNQNHDNYYENTMNAADLIFSHDSQDNLETGEISQVNDNKSKTKEQKESPKAETKNSVESKNDFKNVLSNEISSENSADIIPPVPLPPKIPQSTEKTPKALKTPKTPKANEKSKTKSNSSKLNDLKKTQNIEKNKNAVKIPDGLGRIEEGLEREGTNDNVKVAQGKRKKGKAKSQPKQTKVEKTPKKPVKKVEEEKPQDNVVNSVKYVKPSKPVDVEKEKKVNTKTTDNKTKAKENLVKKLKPDNAKEQIQKVIPKSKPEPPSKPILAGIGAQQKPVKAMAQGVKPEKKVSEEKLPISKPSEIEPIVEEEVIKPTSPANERRKSIVQQREIVKKEKRDGRKCVKKPEEVKKLPDLEVDVKKVESWIFESEDFSEKKDPEKEEIQVEAEPLPSLSADLNPELIEKEKKERKEKRRKSVLANLINSDKAIKKWRKPGHLDSSYADELRRLELAEARRKRQMEMFERLKNRRVSNFGDGFDDGSPRFEDCKVKSRPMSAGSGLDFDDGFLAKYCIFTKGNIEMYRHAFEAVDEENNGWLEGEDVMIALRGVNNKLTEAEEEYLYRVLELTGYKLTHGADFKIFSVLAALSQRISALDIWMKNLIGKMDFKALEMKMFKCKTLWECNVDKDTNSISIDQLCVDLRAGGVSYEHEIEVREKLAHLHAIDLLDFLTYIPLFIMIHEAVVKNPLDDTRNK